MTDATPPRSPREAPGDLSATAKRELRRREVARLMTSERIRNQSELARRLGVNKATISRDVAAILEEWRRERLEYADALVELELETLNADERELRRDWMLARGLAEGEENRMHVRKVERRIYDGDDRTITEEEDEILLEGAGDLGVAIRAYDRIHRVGDARRRILGLYAPERHELSGPHGGKIPVEWIQSMLPDGDEGDDGPPRLEDDEGDLAS